MQLRQSLGRDPKVKAHRAAGPVLGPKHFLVFGAGKLHVHEEQGGHVGVGRVGQIQAGQIDLLRNVIHLMAQTRSRRTGGESDSFFVPKKSSGTNVHTHARVLFDSSVISSPCWRF